LGDPIRLAMVARLCKDRPLRTIKLTRGTGVTRQGLTKHLHVLEEAGLVNSDRFGRERQSRMQAEKLATLRDYLDQVSAQ
jgi:DNA-binding transcriptional ArsR family regulator